MKKYLLITLSFLPFVLAVGYAAKVYAWKLWNEPTSLHEAPAPTSPGRIQVALLLDVSGSMDGLIDQAQSQLWDMVNQLGEARRDGSQPQIELALYIYGGDFIPNEQGHIRQLVPLTNDLDAVSEQLFAQTTDGGEEYAGWVIRDAVQELEWSRAEEDLRMIFIAGNESFAQGPVLYNQSCAAATEAGILINTIFCGDYEEGRSLQWHMGAQSTGGQYLHIDHNLHVEHIPTPYDESILELNQRLNDTYVPYGLNGAELKSRQETQDQQMVQKYGSSGLSKRAMAKSKSQLYCNSHWDLVDACAQKDFDWTTVDQETLSPALKGLSPEELKLYVEEQAQLRKTVQASIADLENQRKTFEAAERAKLSETDSTTLDKVMRKTVREQAQTKHFSFE